MRARKRSAEKKKKSRVMFNVPSGTIAGGEKAVCSVFISKDVRLANIRVFFSFFLSWMGPPVALVWWMRPRFTFSRARRPSQSAAVLAELRSEPEATEGRSAHTYVLAQTHWWLIKKWNAPPSPSGEKEGRCADARLK